MNLQCVVCHMHYVKSSILEVVSLSHFHNMSLRRQHQPLEVHSK